mmetsp:Transcript_27288/g.37600  ORF Transcript_27288/g.37600 Transcript_27288/m.37600 type:complete len:243 (-) Transcript_27288:2020-2748(-)
MHPIPPMPCFPRPGLELVQVPVQRGQLGHQVLPDSDGLDDLAQSTSGVLEVPALQQLPVVEHELREGGPGGGGGQGLREAEGLGHGQVGLHLGHAAGHGLALVEHVTAAHGHDVVDGAHDGVGAGDVHQEDRLQQRGAGQVHAGVGHAAGRGRDLAHAAVDGVRMQRHVVDDELEAAHPLLAQRPLIAGPLEAAHHRVLDLDQVRHAHRPLRHHVGADVVVSKAPDLLRRGGLLPAKGRVLP